MLAPAGLVKFDDEIRFLGFEICGRIVEREMPILPDPKQAELGINRAKRFAILARSSLGIGRVPVDFVERSHCDVCGETLAQISAKRSPVIGGQGDILVHVKACHAFPGETLHRGERGKKFVAKRPVAPGGEFQDFDAKVRRRGSGPGLTQSILVALKRLGITRDP